MTPRDTVCLYGNGSGDFVELKPLDDGLVYLKLGHCCLIEIDHVVPVEFITALIAGAVIEAGSLEEALRKTHWNPEFLDQLCAKIKVADPMIVWAGDAEKEASGE